MIGVSLQHVKLVPNSLKKNGWKLQYMSKNRQNSGLATPMGQGLVAISLKIVIMESA